MNRSVLAGLLALQILIVGAVMAWNLQEPEKPGDFFDFDPLSITELVVNAEGNTVNVAKADDAWTLEDGKPADGEKVLQVLEKLADASTGWPVATSSSTAERFEVSENRYQKRLTLKADEDVVADAFFGTSPGYRKVHVSAADGGPVFAIEFSNYELGTDNTAWLDKSLLKPEGSLTRLVHEGEYELSLEEDAWVAASGEELDEETVDKVVGRFENLSVFSISDDELPEEVTAQLTWTDDLGDTTLSLYHLTENEDWVATSDRVAGQYGISTYIAKDMAMKLEDLLVVEEADDDEDDATEAPSDDEAATTQ